MSEILVIDVGNTRAKWAIVGEQKVVQRGAVPTLELIASLPDILAKSASTISWCSVVQMVSEPLSTALTQAGRAHHRLTCHDAPGLPFSYPKPEQVGQDRLANAIGAQALVGAPAAVVDMGTATTFDLVSAKQGFIGGIILPGLASMTDYLNEKVSMLPKLNPNELSLSPRIGRSTLEAMQVGCARGYPSMIRGLLDGVRDEFAALGEPEPTVILTGGATRGVIREALAEYRAEPDLTLIGLAEAQRRRMTTR
ncbi:type III pantothenate kinase [Cerasicoccus frondis]|uniref:type III pantothenate kinase n=1 Tax=Cerasicoccus frondis TaxID=490090 RepID=UPI002852B3F2|nr:type III pantothenate kinase [Cerasicoccus frondis]